MDAATESAKVLLDRTTIPDDSSEATEYMIDTIPEETNQLLGAELLQPHTGLVDLASTDFIPVGYTSEDLLNQDLTEEDRNLAAALVAVQLSQQQKHQHLHDSVPTDAAKALQDHESMIIQDKTSPTQALTNSNFIEIVGNESIFIEKQPVLSKEELLRFARESQFVRLADRKSELVKIDELKHESDAESQRSDTVKTSSRKSLPHKKRISRKLKKPTSPNTVSNAKTTILTQNVTINNTKIICNLCEQTFTSPEDFAQHQLLCQTTITPITTSLFSCQLCEDQFNDQLRFFEHLKKHYEPLQIEASDTKVVEATDQNRRDSLLSSLLNLSCLMCNKTFRKQKLYENHMRDVHPPAMQKVDMNEFSEPEDLMEGINVVVEPDPHSDLDDDTKAWYREDDLKQTEKDLKELEADDEHVCHLCKQPFPLEESLMEHLETCKQNKKSDPNYSPTVKKKSFKKKGTFNCPKCERIFAHRNSLMYHMRGHSGIRPHQCDQCGKSFFASSALKVHMRLHSGDKPYNCCECGKTFRQWGDLKYHLTSLHSTEKQFQCEFCGKEFARKYSLIVHRRIHTGEKNYKCEYCDKTFRASSYLQNHRRIHTGEKPHSCSVCGKPFRVRSDMKRHQKTHSKYATAKTTEGEPAARYPMMAKVEKVETGEDESTELHIEDDETECILEDYDPLTIESNNVTNKGVYLNELFMVSYPNELPGDNRSVPSSESSSSTWIQTDP